MNQKQTNEEQFEELSINTVDGLRLFLENAQAQYRNGLTLFDSTDFQSSDRLEKIFDSVRQVAKRLITKVSAGETVDYADAAELQQKYDRMISFLQQSKTVKPESHNVTPVKPAKEEHDAQKQVQVTSAKETDDNAKKSQSDVFQTSKKPERRNPQNKPRLADQSSKERLAEKKIHPVKKLDKSPGQPKAELASVLQQLNNEKAPEKNTAPVTKKPLSKKLVTQKTGPTAKAAESKKIATEETLPLKPKTGTLQVAAEDVKDEDAKERVGVNSQPEEAKVRDLKERVLIVSHVENKEAQGEEVQADIAPVEEVVENELVFSPASVQANQLLEKIRKTEQLSTLRRDELVAIYPNLNAVQQLLFDEVAEGIEYLSQIREVEQITPDTEETVLQVVSHVRRALQSIKEAAVVEVGEMLSDRNRVPVVTEQAQSILVTDNSNKASVSSPVSFVPTSVTTRNPTVAKRTVPRRLQTLPKPSAIYETESLTDLYLNAPEDRQFIIDHYSSTKEFERLLDATITQIEASTIDGVDKWLGDLPASAFAFVKDSYVSEVLTFARRSYNEVAADLAAENIKYETFAEWRDLIDEMIELISAGREMKYGELFARWMLAMAMEEQDLTRSSVE